jgi:hypothetical protein
MTGILSLKLFLVPSLIYAVTLAGRRWGPMVAGWLSAFPVVSGPILLAVTLEQGSDFGATAAEGTLLAVVAILIFSLGYAWASNMFGVLGSMSSALAVYTMAVVVLQSIHLSVTWCFAVVISALLVVPKLFPHVPAQPSPSKSGLDLPWRMLAGAVLVLVVTFSAARLGARASGFLAMFPVMSTVLVGFSHHYSGRAFAVALLRGMVTGYFAFATFCLIVSVLLRGQPIAAAFSSALLGALIVQIAVKGLVSRDRHSRAASGGGGGAA